MMREKHITDIRAFNRFYTDIIGLLDKYILNSNYALPEVRILYELYHHQGLTARDIIESLHIDKGYLSRILRQFEKKKLIVKKHSKEDSRSVHLSLTMTGRDEFELLNEASNTQIREIIGLLTDKECDRLILNMSVIKKILTRTYNNKLK